ncbi:hypothetical protein O181_004533 [Austropuccinia psidii MF-1]|uniref:Uncharacterized protein n=1 Tax=Austropuccinia psidii MF-1 TaxID=1389203 RepID=A0A9Q3BGS7_9BASI|nr:hypothetical protein [Austropuccinia psidii MF-1]
MPIKGVNRGGIRMDCISSNYHGHLQRYIHSFRKMNLLIGAVKINIKAEILSFSILGKLLRDLELQNYVKVLNLNADLIEKPDLILTKLQDSVNNIHIQPEKINTTSSAHPYNITHYCGKGKHNPNSTSHSKEKCFSENPDLRRAKRSNCRRFPSNIPLSAHISSALS